MIHPLQEDLTLFAAGALGGDDLLRVSAHVEGCAECRAQASRTAVANDCAIPLREIKEVVAGVEAGALEPADALRRLDDAAPALRAAVAAVESVPLKLLYGRVLRAQGWIHLNGGRLKKGRDLNLLAREVFASIGDEIEVARTLAAEANSYGSSGPTPRAYEALREARAIYTRYGDHRRLAWSRGIEAHLLYAAGQFREAATMWQGLLDECAADDPWRSHWLHNVALCHAKLGVTDGAEQLEIEALSDPIYAASSDGIKARWTLVLADANRGNFEDAIARMARLTDEAAARGQQFDAMAMTCSIADMLSLLGRHEEAAAVLQSVLQYLATEDLPVWVKTALALLRDAVTHQSPNMIEELDKFRNEFPHLLAPPPVPLNALATEAARRRNRGDA